VVGIDPGKRGAVVVLTADGVGKILRADQWVTGGEYDPLEMELSIGRYRYLPIVVEKQGPRPGQGVTSTYATGYGYGLWRGILATAPTVIAVTPQRWQAQVHAGAPGRGPKQRSLWVARQRLGLEDITHDVADAACIALYGLSIVGGDGS